MFPASSGRREKAEEIPSEERCPLKARFLSFHALSAALFLAASGRPHISGVSDTVVQTASAGTAPAAVGDRSISRESGDDRIPLDLSVVRRNPCAEAADC